MNIILFFYDPPLQPIKQIQIQEEQKITIIVNEPEEEINPSDENRLLNMKDFKYIIPQTRCTFNNSGFDETPFLVVFVHSGVLSGECFHSIQFVYW